jgi:hypothetical protein
MKLRVFKVIPSPHDIPLPIVGRLVILAIDDMVDVDTPHLCASFAKQITFNR